MRTVRRAIHLTALLMIAITAQAQSSALDKPLTSIRLVDFLNFTYEPSCISGTLIVPPHSNTVTTVSGQYDNSHDPQVDIPVHFAVQDVIYGELRADGTEQAIVLTGCNLGGTGYWTEAFIFELRAGKPLLIESIGGGDRAMGGIKSIRIDGHLIKVARQYGVALCCADYIETTVYQTRGAKLVPFGTPKRVVARSGKPIKSLHFERGASSGTISGQTDSDAIYELRARAGQLLVIEPLRDLPTRADVDVDVMDPDGITLKEDRDGKIRSFRLPSSGLYTIVVSSNQSDVPYAFKVTIH